MSGFLRSLLLVCASALASVGCGPGNGPSAADSTAKPAPALHAAADLPAEVLATLALIRSGGPFPYRKDGSVFRNRERLLPQRARDYYREYTVPTPGARDRGARRIVTGGRPPEIYYYTADHYRSFRRIEARP
ncbi:MAG: ribonuclease [Rhodocyclaceae bacterium]|nr:ribonuclease [Rhodocyclaceae bacterium]